MKTNRLHLIKYGAIPFLIISFSFSKLNAQILTGKVSANQSNNESLLLTGATVYWNGTTIATVTNEKGEFQIPISDNSQQLIITSVGYANDTITVQDPTQPISVSLQRGINLSEVIVEERGSGVIRSSLDVMDRVNITTHELRKAACCSLAESFETNSSVDVNYTDAVSGARQIQLLGLKGDYVQMLTENIPNYRGLATPFGLGYIPGPWMQSIQVSKGTSSVKNGYEAIAGQINIEYKKPEDAEKLFINSYVNNSGKIETNINSGVAINKQWSTMILGHTEHLVQKNDENNDGFLDMPLAEQYHFFNRWNYQNLAKGLESRFGVKYLNENLQGGQLSFNPSATSDINNGYGIGINTERFEVFQKTGYIFPNQNVEQSIGVITNFSYHSQNSFYGLNDYDATQYSGYANVVYEGEYIGHDHKYSTGISYQVDKFDELFNAVGSEYVENVPGVFFQHSSLFAEKFSLIAGIRADYHNHFGLIYTPRVHVKWDMFEKTTLRVSAGKGYRTAHVLAENNNILASSRVIRMADDLAQEAAWNYGGNISQKVRLGSRDVTINVDYYHTQFENQIIIDGDKDIRSFYIYNLTGESFSDNYQLEVKYEPIRRLDITLAYRYTDVKQTLADVLQTKPFYSAQKGLATFSYRTRKKWQFDYTLQFNGGGRIPSTQQNIMEYQRANSFEAFTIMNGQVSKDFRKWGFYFGGENLTDFMQHHPIISSDNPFGDSFDATMIWGPVHGRKLYAGIRVTL